MKPSFWTIWIQAKSSEKALKVFARTLACAAQIAQRKEIEPYPKLGGFVIRFQIALEGVTRNDLIVEALIIGQSMASDWMVNGDMAGNPGAWSLHGSEPGVIAIEWSLN